jgi:hypothetical protein
MTNKTISDVYSELSSIILRGYEKVGDSILMKTEHGIIVYNRYAIFKSNGGIKLGIRDGSPDIIEFNKAKNALVWAILHRFTKISEANRVLHLDAMIAAMDVEIAIHRKLQKTKDSEKYLIYSSKLQQNIARQKQFLSELDKYIILAQRCQQRGLKK